jgi:small-conductance mechanosensitive channel
MIPTLPEMFKIVDATAGCVTTNGGVTGQYINVKTGQMLFLVLSFTQAVGHATVITLKEATTVAGGSVKTVINTHKVWSNAATATNDILVRGTDATGLTLGSGVAKMQVVFEIDPAALDTANGFTCVGFTLSDSSQATNFVSGVYLLQTRFVQATPPSAVVN